MKLLLDRHALIWFLENDRNLSKAACDAIKDAGNLCYVSDVSAWEIAIKNALGKLDLPVRFDDLFPREVVNQAGVA